MGIADQLFELSQGDINLHFVRFFFSLSCSEDKEIGLVQSFNKVTYCKGKKFVYH